MTETDPREFKLLDPDNNIIMRGSLSAVTECIVDSRARADAISLLEDAAKAVGLLEQQQQHEAQLREREVRAFCDGIAALARRLDALEQRRAEHARQAAEDEARAIQQKLDAMPDPDDPNAALEHPTGELHQVEANAPARRAQLAAGDQGDLPREITRDVPPDLGTEPVFDPAELAHPQQPPAQPVAVSLNEG
jgi:hypothetical protein